MISALLLGVTAALIVGAAPPAAARADVGPPLAHAFCDERGNLHAELPGLRLTVSDHGFFVGPSTRPPPSGRSPGPVTALSYGGGAFLMALAGDDAGLYRAVNAHDGLRSVPLARGQVLAACGQGNGEVWAAVAGAEAVQLVRASSRTPAVLRYGVDEAVASAFAHPDTTGGMGTLAASAIGELLRAAVSRGWPHCPTLLRAVAQREEPAARLEAAMMLSAWLPSTAVSVLWALSTDPVEGVRKAAFAAAKARCAHESAAICAGLLSFFAEDPTDEIGWEARDLLLQRDVTRALRTAPKAYKLDLLSSMGYRLETAERGDRALARHVLEMLVTDLDLEVRETASMVLGRLEP